MYKQIKIDGVLANTIQRLSDNAFIPFAPDNTDYQTYLKWVAEGNLPHPADFVEPSNESSVVAEPADQQGEQA